VLTYNENGSLEVAFGDGVYGVSPTLGTGIVVNYIANSLKSTLADTTFALKKNLTGRSITSFTYNSVYTQGTNIETIAQMRYHASKAYMTRKGIFNVEDLQEILLRDFPLVKAVAYVWDNTYTFYVIPSNGTPADQTYLDSIRDIVAPRVVGGFGVGGAVTSYVSIYGVLEVFVLPEYNTTPKLDEVKAVISSYTDPLLEGVYGKDFVLADVVNHVVPNVIGVTNLRFTAIKGGAPVDVSVLPTSILSAWNWGLSTISLIDSQ
jgi:hypothetical protein